MRNHFLLIPLFLFLLGPPLRADEAKKPESYQVPYRLSDSRHLVVRAKINSKGPFNLIVDTGAPALYVTRETAKKAGVTADKNDWGNLDRFEIEGGLLVPESRARVEDIFQIEGMNGLGAAGVELHGMLGFNILARFKIEYDLTRDKMTWTPTDFEPKLPAKFGKGAPAGMEAMGSIMKVLGFAMGRKANPGETLRGFLGVELSDGMDGVEVKSLIEKGPAATAGLKTGDRITHVQSKAVKNADEFRQLASKIAAGATIELSIERDRKSRNITVTTGKGM